MDAPINHPLSDETIAEYWPDMDTPEGRVDIRRQFNALMEQVRLTATRGFPRWPEVMAPVVAEKARTLPDRLNGLKAALAGLPEHWRQWQWSADAKQSFGEKYVRVVGDSGYGMGRQYIAAIPAGPKTYFGTVAEYIAAANPDTITMLLSAYESLSSDAVRDVVAERRRQLDAEGMTAAHDDVEYSTGEMAQAASVYASYASSDGKLRAAQRFRDAGRAPATWPWAVSWWKPATARRMLVKAAALIIAEIERLDRKAAK
ncbi:hypothetical protein NKH10_19240 [Mesorhizobium sp. M1340]|uniref:hypothetical protein n=1 Tax=Mesorhizobium sp. M1340 TaxID=2957087 RepID=UPI00333674EC